MQVEFTLNPPSGLVDYLCQAINADAGTIHKAYTFGFFMRDDAPVLIAGCNGSVIFGSIYIDQLWVEKKYRGQGLGKQLMEAVHDYGRTCGCSMATVATMSFQGARTFYEKLGYVMDFERTGYAQNSSCIFLKRSL